uniref:Reverse transcriptase Ty1/copia-type domain-containing protein n=1 Tax=Tanacetum cinerariifolium TaxID=118510 RepID=A0A699HQN6_TANCI|nr:hypothetical protein [Tanacetum cinerariifolium]
METLTVETPIPTVSSLVPTACLDDSPQLSSDTRLISKRATSQDDTSSLDNILTLTNRFEDILGVTTNTCDTNGVEADLSNIENNISASPTPTFRIHKDHLKRVRPIGTKWVFKNKKDERGIVIRNKARLVAQGHTQEKGIDYEEVFAPVARIEAIRLFLAYASFMGFIVYQMDVKHAFLYGIIDEEVYVMQPLGFQDSEFPARVYKVEKAIEFEALMHEKFQMSAMGELNFFLGLQVLQKKDDIFLSQDKYVGDILKKFRYSDVRSMIGSLMYLTASRPNIMFTVFAYDGHQVTPKECYLHAVKRIFRYLKGHPKVGIWYPKDSPFDLVAYSNSDYGGATQGSACHERLCLKGITSSILLLLAICDYHNMIAILEKYEHNIDFHQIVDFVEASHIRYALTVNLAVYVSHIRQFWSTARVETLDEETKILATIDGKPRTISESSIRRNLKLKDEAGISSLPDAELFKNLSLMGRAGIAQSLALPTATDEPASPLGDDSQGEACPIVSGLEAEQDRANIIKTSTLPHDSPPRVTSLAADEGSMQQKLNELTDLCTRLQRQQTEMASKITAQDLEIASLKARIKLLEDKDGGGDEPSGEDATIKGRSLETGEEAVVEKSTKRGSNDTEELVNVLTSLDAANILTSGGVQVVSVSCAAEVPTVSVSTGSGMVSTTSLIFTTASVVTPYSRRKGKEKMVETDTPKKKKLQEQIDVQMAREIEEQLAREDQKISEQIARDAEIARIHAEEELQMLIDSLDRTNETIAKYLQEYEQFAVDLSNRERIELINDLVKYQDNYSKFLKYQSQQRKPLSKKQQREFYIEKFIPVWKQIKDFIPMGSKEERERFKRKGLRLEQERAKKVKTSKEVSKEDLKTMMHLVPVKEVYVEALQVKHLIIDWEIHTEGQRTYWKIIRQFISDKEKELWVELKRLYEPDVEDQLWIQTQALMHDPVEWRLYDTCGVHYVLLRDQEIFMLVEKEYPLRKGLVIVMISNKLQVENYSQMANDLI